MRLARDDGFQEYVYLKRAALLRTATLMLHGDAHRAEDLVQITLTRLYLAWPRAQASNLDAYVRRMLVNALIDETRRPFRRREVSHSELREDAVEDRYRVLDRDPELMAALAHLPAGMRAAVVLRHVDALSVEEVADALGCSAGTVKSQTARGLQQLRHALRDRAPAAC